MKPLNVILCLLLFSSISQAQSHLNGIKDVQVAQAQTITSTSNCITAPCQQPINVPWDSAGSPMTGNGIWGTGGAYQVPIQFTVPAGFHVVVQRVFGDVVSWPHGNAVTGKFAGILFGFILPQAGASTVLEYANNGCILYHQATVGTNGTTEYFDNTITSGFLGSDNEIILQIALYESELGVSVHTEVTLNVVFQFVLIQ
jgi:hypothetical protein